MKGLDCQERAWMLSFPGLEQSDMDGLGAGNAVTWHFEVLAYGSPSYPERPVPSPMWSMEWNLPSHVIFLGTHKYVFISFRIRNENEYNINEYVTMNPSWIYIKVVVKYTCNSLIHINQKCLELVKIIMLPGTGQEQLLSFNTC